MLVPLNCHMVRIIVQLYSAYTVETMIYSVSFKRLGATPTTLAELERVILHINPSSQFKIFIILYELIICYLNVCMCMWILCHCRWPFVYTIVRILVQLIIHVHNYIYCFFLSFLILYLFLQSLFSFLINPRRACAARVTVLGLSFRLSVCLSVTTFSATTRNKAAKKRYQRVQYHTGLIFKMAIFVKVLRSKVMT